MILRNAHMFCLALGMALVATACGDDDESFNPLLASVELEGGATAVIEGQQGKISVVAYDLRNGARLRGSLFDKDRQAQPLSVTPREPFGEFASVEGYSFWTVPFTAPTLPAGTDSMYASVLIELLRTDVPEDDTGVWGSAELFVPVERAP